MLRIELCLLVSPINICRTYLIAYTGKGVTGWLASMTNPHHHALLYEIFSHTSDSFTMQSRQIRGRQTYPTNEAKSIGGVKTNILQSIDAILVYIVTRCGQEVANRPHPRPLTGPAHHTYCNAWRQSIANKHTDVRSLWTILTYYNYDINIWIEVITCYNVPV